MSTELPAPEAQRLLWLWYSPFGLGGVETFLLNLARVLSRKRVGVTVAAVYEAEGPLAREYAALGIPVLDWTGFYPAYMGKSDAAAVRKRLVGDLLNLRPTAIMINDCSDFAIGSEPLLERVRRFASVVDTLHIDAPSDQYLELRMLYLSTLDGVAGTNRRILERLERRFTTSTPVHRYIPNGVEMPARERTEEPGLLRLLYCGRLAQEQKRILLLPAILERLEVLGVRYRMTIAGDGPERETLEREIEARGMTAGARVVGPVAPETALDLYFDHDVMLNLSTYEGFSMSMIEALAAGCVPACTDLPSLDPSILRDGTNCILVPLEEPERIADRLATLSRDELRRMSANASESGRSLTVERTASSYLEFLGELRNRRPIESWDAAEASLRGLEWDVTRDNPWLPRPGRRRKILSILRSLFTHGGDA